VITTKDIKEGKRPIFCDVSLVEGCDLVPAIVLCEIIRFREQRMRDDGWTWFVYKEMASRTCLTTEQIRRALRALVEEEFIQMKKMRIKRDRPSAHSPIVCNHFKIDDDRVKFYLDAPTLEEDEEIMRQMRMRATK